MTRHLRKMHVLIIIILCGLAISASYYVVQPLDSRRSYKSLPALLRPVYLLSLLDVMPRVFVARIIWEALGLPGWLGEILFVSYWPALGAFVGTRQHWVAWGVGALAVNIGLLALFLYALSKVRFSL
jgi:hypothetical protein